MTDDLRFVTTNEGKVAEAREYLSDLVQVSRFEFEYTEIQSNSLVDIAEFGVREAYEEGGGPVMVEDSGLFISALNGFPGPYSAFIYSTLGNDRVWRIVRDEDDQVAFFRSVISYCDGNEVLSFEGAVRGRIVEPRGESGFGYDPLFEYDGQTFAELSTQEKNAVSHRGRALAKFASWLADEPAERKGVA